MTGTQLESYVEDNLELSPEWKMSGVTRTKVSSAIHHMTVCDVREWDEEMHPQVNDLNVGQTTILISGAYEYLKVTKVSKDTFDTEFGSYEEVSNY